MIWQGLGVISTSKGDVESGGVIPPDSLPLETIESLKAKGRIKDEPSEIVIRSEDTQERSDVQGADTGEPLSDEIQAQKGKRGKRGRPKKRDEAS